jgi:sporulation protein YlmC with PRC-barrel domain
MQAAIVRALSGRLVYVSERGKDIGKVLNVIQISQEEYFILTCYLKTLIAKECSE